MSKREAIIRYNLIINKLRKKTATFKEISEYLNKESELQDIDFTISIRTFQRDIKDISALYKIDIQFDFSNGVYYIENDNQSDFNNKLRESFDTFYALQLSEGISEHVHFEKRKAHGTEHLYILLHAIKNLQEVTFNYQSFEEDKPGFRVVCPYAIKEFKNRWYVLANNTKYNNIRCYALDRITQLELTSKTFETPKNFNADALYKNCFGIILPNEGQKVKDILLSFTKEQGNYIKTLPLHETQQIIKDNDKELQIKLSLYITFDFIMELLSYAENVKVIQPESLAEVLKDKLKAAYKQYKH